MNFVDINFTNTKIEEILGLVSSPAIALSELIKNGLDSNSKTVYIYIDTKKKEITVVDYGDGFSLTDITNLGTIGESAKKEGNNLFRLDGEYYGGSKGLGILSAFFLSNYIEIETRNNNKSYLIKWKKGMAKFSYEEIDSLSHTGTKLTMKNVSKDNITLLTDKNEYSKLKHFDLSHFKHIKNNSIKFLIDGKEDSEFSCSNITKFEDEFSFKINFEYISETNSLKYLYEKFSNFEKYNNLPTSKLYVPLNISLDNNIIINDIIKNSYDLSKVQMKNNYNFKYLNANLESFNGTLWIKQFKTKNSELSSLGYGVKVFVNNYAMYAYINNENDWLGLSQLSQTKKNTTLKLHNVFGYVNFNNFNEKSSYLTISNERASFIENVAFKKFMEIMKEIIVKIAFEVDVAYRNANVNNYEDSIPNSNNGNTNTEDANSNSNADIKDTSPNDNADTKDTNPNDNADTKDTNPNDNADTKDTNPNDNADTKDTNPNDNADTKDTDSNGNTTKKPKWNFFSDSRMIKDKTKISVPYNDLISQLKSLSYKNYYLIYSICFRGIIEDIAKTYLSTRHIDLDGDLGKNVKNMIDDISKVIKDVQFISPNDKKDIENIFGGHNALGNYLDATGIDFYDTNKGTQGSLAKKLNSYTHNPRWIDKEEAESLSNDIILVLMILSNEILKRIKNKEGAVK